MHLAVNDEAAGSRATLPRGAEGSPDHAVQCEVEIGIIHHDHGVLATHLERQPLVHPAAGLADDRTGGGGPGERDDRHLGMLHQRPVSYTHLRAHETPEHLVCRLLLEKKKTTTANN